jgi:hypothetical protein
LVAKLIKTIKSCVFIESSFNFVGLKKPCLHNFITHTDKILVSKKI